MQRRNSAIARILAALALIAAVAAIVIVVGNATEGDPQPGTSKGQASTAEKKQPKPKPKTNAKTYTVKEGDNLTLIAEATGISVTELRQLNPEVDPQILSVGEKLKLR